MGHSGMQHATLALLLEPDYLWLGCKKRGFGKGKLNGFGGKQEGNETIEEAMLRELMAEAHVQAIRYEKVGELTYRFEHEPSWNQVVHIYRVSEWQGVPKESEEMTCEKFPLTAIPYDRMWDNDKQWLPHVLAGKKVKGAVVHTDKTTVDAKIDIVDHF